MGLLNETWDYLKIRKKWWLLPIVMMLLFFGALLLFSNSGMVSTFVYALF